MKVAKISVWCDLDGQLNYSREENSSGSKRLFGKNKLMSAKANDEEDAYDYISYSLISAKKRNMTTTTGEAKGDVDQRH